MIRVLQTFSVVSLTAAIAVFVFCVIQWTRGRPEIELGREHSIVEEFKQRGGESSKGSQQVVSPLVKQAKDFASYLDPPEPPKPVHAHISRPAVNRSVMTVKRPKTTPQFTLLATSYYRAMPEESLALVSEPGREARWIKQGDRLGHFILAKIERGMIVYRDGDRLREMAVKTKVPVHTDHVLKSTLASNKIRISRPRSTSPDQPQKTGPRRSIRRLGPYAKISM